MMRVVIEMITATIACFGFSIIYQARPNRLVLCGLSGGITWGVCRLAEQFNSNLFIYYMIAAAFGTLLSEFLARRTKCPATIFLIPALLPMVPGGSLYYTTYAIVTGDHKGAIYYGQRTALAALGIAVGLVIVSVFMYYFNELKSHMKKA
ncbi:Uncharacterized membrane protein YjjB, DUF3815 family [Lachnospiraceae bacterium XBB1006]|nr:Uncharacterized membrane protein YjjB, DUF3815 family [Lachnospiraceae bacterium XBB1006]